MHSSKKGSVTVRIKGGLGNQLFQYASAKALASQLSADFFLDVAWFQKANSNRKFKLPELGIVAESIALSKTERNSKKLASQLLPERIAGVRHIREPADFAYHAFKVSDSQHLYLDGYWQSEKYFSAIRQQLLDEIDLNSITSAANAVPFQSSDTVAVHIRRGDYITESSSQALSIDYVQRAMAGFDKSHSFMFFSDDIDWCKQHFTGSDIAFANNESDLQDLKQMSEAAHNIIANSTFSWWSAWLNKNQGQRVIAPTPWTNENTHKDILPTSWETIDMRQAKQPSL